MIQPLRTEDRIENRVVSHDDTANKAITVNSEKDKKRIQRKSANRNRETGKEYLGYRRTGSTVKQNVVRLACKQRMNCAFKFCRKSAVKQCNLFTGIERTTMFEYFWRMNWAQKKQYVCNMIKIFPKKSSTSDTSRRDKSRNYFLIKSDGEKYRVCQKMFFNTLGLNEKMVRIWLNSKQEFGMFENPDDVREKIANKVRQGETFKKNQEKKNYLRQFLVTLPKLETHYCRKDSKKKYLQTEHRSYTDVYKDYVRFCEEDKCQQVSISVFLKMLKELNVALFKPRKDQCDDCAAHKAGNRLGGND